MMDKADKSADASVSVARLYVLRAMYALIAFAMGLMIWPAILTGSGDWALMPGVVKCMMGALTLLALLGIRYPLKMLPLLFWELSWKTIWLIAVALPQYSSGGLDVETAEMAIEVGFVLLVYLAIPWRHVYRTYILASADRWSFA